MGKVNLKTKVDMKNVRIKVSYSRTINLGNYESMQVQAGLEYDVKDSTGAELQKEFSLAFENVEEMLLHQLDKLEEDEK